MTTTVKGLIPVLMFIISFTPVLSAQYNPQIDPQSNGNCEIIFQEIGTNAGDAGFYLFGDGYYYNNLSPIYQYEMDNTYNVEAWFVERYKTSRPKKKSATVIINNCTNPTPRPIINMQNDLIKVGQSWHAAPGNFLFYIITVQHTSEEPLSGHIEFKYNTSHMQLEHPDSIRNYNGWFTNFSTTPINQNAFNEKISLDFTNLKKDEQRLVYLPMNINRNVDTEQALPRVATIHNSRGEVIGTASSNTSHVQRNPHDPNTKTIINAEYLKPNKEYNQTLKYIVRFQNEGEGTAQNVEIIDELSDKLIPSSFEYIESSATCFSDYNENVLTLEFPNINLPGSAAPMPNTFTYDETMGYVIFQVCTETELSPELCIDNTAAIFFDNQPAVETNQETICAIEGMNNDQYPPECINVLGEQLAIGSSSLNENTFKHGELSLAVYPNPILEEGTIQFDLPENTLVNLSLFDGFGKIMSNIIPMKEMSEGRFEEKLDTSILPAGIYFLCLKTKKETVTQRVIVIK